MVLCHILDSLVPAEGLLPVGPVEGDDGGGEDGVGGDAVRHHSHAPRVGPRDIEALHSAQPAEIVPGG